MSPAYSTHLRRLTFKLLFIFLLLFVVSGLDFGYLSFLHDIPGIKQLLEVYKEFVIWLVSWAGNNIFSIDEIVTFRSTGSSDTIFHWVEAGTYLILALVGGITWAIIDRNRREYKTLIKWFNIILVYNFCYHLIVYGLIKVFGGQFFQPGEISLVEPFGDNSPMRILWLSMGSAPVYSKFTGWVETITVCLLLFRKTRTLGAFMALGVMVNVFMINMTYDVPVKLFSFRMLITALWLLAQDYRRVYGIFITNHPIPATRTWRPLFTTRWKILLTLSIQIIIMGWQTYRYLEISISIRKNVLADRPELLGVHEVETFAINNDTLPPLTTDSVRWQRAFVRYVPWSASSYYTIQLMNNESTRYKMEIDTLTKGLRLESLQDSTEVHTFTYSIQGTHVYMSGLFKGDSVNMSMNYFTRNDFLLLNRGFNWVNSSPPNFSLNYRDYRNTEYYREE